MSLFNSIESLINVCQFTGLATFSMNLQTLKWESNSSLKVLAIIYLVFLFTILLIAIVFNNIFINYISEIQGVLFNIFLYINLLHAISVILEFWIKQNQQIKLMNLFLHLDNLLKQYFNEHIEYTRLQIMCRRIIFVWLCEISSLLITTILNYIGNPTDFMIPYLIVFFPGFVLSKLSYAYAVFLINLVHENICVMNNYIKSVSKQNGYYICEKYNKPLKTKHREWNHIFVSNTQLSSEILYNMKDIYSQIWEAILIIKRVVLWSMLIGLANDFFVLTFNLYWFASFLFFLRISLTAYFLLVVIILSNLGNMLFIANHCANLTKAVSWFQIEITLLYLSLIHKCLNSRWLFSNQIFITSHSIFRDRNTN